jgi:hypothetical protein
MSVNKCDIYKNKYLKYKDKYINLKNKMDQIISEVTSIYHIAEFENNEFFDQTSDKMIVSDPSYDYIAKEHEPGSGLMKLNLVLDNVAKGKWRALLLINSLHIDQNAALLCFSDENEKWKKDREFINYSIFGDWKKVGTIGVDSGQAGIYDLKYYRDDNVVPKKISKNSETSSALNSPGKEWFEMNNNLTSEPTDYGGVMKYGTVSASGHGDGLYNVYVLRDNKSKIVGVKIIFIK